MKIEPTTTAARARDLERCVLRLEKLIDLKRTPIYRRVSGRFHRALVAFRAVRGAARAKRADKLETTFSSVADAAGLLIEGTHGIRGTVGHARGRLRP